MPDSFKDRQKARRAACKHASTYRTHGAEVKGRRTVYYEYVMCSDCQEQISKSEK